MNRLITLMLLLAMGLSLWAQDPTPPSADPAPKNLKPLKVKLVKFWPPFSTTLTGKMELVVNNHNAFAVKVGLRSNGKGVDFNVPANGKTTVNAANGSYEIYFEFSTKRGIVYQGEDFTFNAGKGWMQRMELDLMLLNPQSPESLSR